MSSDGRYVLFASDAQGIVRGVRSKLAFVTHVFLRDMRTGRTRVIPYPNGKPALGAPTSISGDGRYVTYYGGSGLRGKLWDRRSGRTVELAATRDAALSGDGRTVAYTDERCTGRDRCRKRPGVIIRDLRTGSARRYGTRIAGTVKDITPDGQYVLLDAAGAIVVLDRRAGKFDTISPASESRIPTGIGADGQTVVFETKVPAVLEDHNDINDCYTVSRSTRAITLISADSKGRAVRHLNCTMSRDGRFVVFSTRSQMDATNNDRRARMYLRDLVNRTVTPLPGSRANVKMILVGSFSDDATRLTYRVGSVRSSLFSLDVSGIAHPAR